MPIHQSEMKLSDHVTVCLQTIIKENSFILCSNYLTVKVCRYKLMELRANTGFRSPETFVMNYELVSLRISSRELSRHTDTVLLSCSGGRQEADLCSSGVTIRNQDFTSALQTLQDAQSTAVGAPKVMRSTSL